MVKYLIENISPGKNLFLTENGYLGVGPSSCVTGDFVCLFDSFNFAVVLRESEELPTEEAKIVDQNPCFQYIGAGHLHWFMDGEIYDMPEYHEEKMYLRQ